MDLIENSSDLESGRRPKFKSVEFFVFTLVVTVNELVKCENAAFHIHAATFGIRSRGCGPERHKGKHLVFTVLRAWAGARPWRSQE